MVENVTEAAERVLNQEEMSKLITIAQFAKMLGCSTGVVRKQGKAGQIPGTYHVMGTIGFNPEEAKGWTPPAGSAARSTRDDGRLIYHIALLPDTEFPALLAEYGEDRLVDPRIEAKKRRAERKAAAAAEKAAAAAAEEAVSPDDVDDEEDLFDGFETE